MRAETLVSAFLLYLATRMVAARYPPGGRLESFSGEANKSKRKKKPRTDTRDPLKQPSQSQIMRIIIDEHQQFVVL